MLQAGRRLTAAGGKALLLAARVRFDAGHEINSGRQHSRHLDGPTSDCWRCLREKAPGYPQPLVPTCIHLSGVPLSRGWLTEQLPPSPNLCFDVDADAALRRPRGMRASLESPRVPVQGPDGEVWRAGVEAGGVLNTHEGEARVVGLHLLGGGRRGLFLLAGREDSSPAASLTNPLRGARHTSIHPGRRVGAKRQDGLLSGRGG